MEVSTDQKRLPIKGQKVTLDLGQIGSQQLEVIEVSEDSLKLKYLSTGKEISLSKEDFFDCLSEPKDIRKIKFIPLGDRILIKPDPSESITQAGIIIPETAKEKPQQGTIIAVGDGKELDNEIIRKLNAIMVKLGLSFKYTPVHQLKEGMRVLYGRNAGSEINYDGRKVLIMRFSDVAGILE